jgi:hypothetical protein
MRAAAMTDPRRTRRGPRVTATAFAAVALFLSLLVLLAWQVRSGRDPALGAAQRPALVAQAPPRRVLVRKIVRRVIDEKVVETDDGPVVVARLPSTGVVVSSAPAIVSSAAPPAPAAAPAAPVVTRSS